MHELIVGCVPIKHEKSSHIFCEQNTNFENSKIVLSPQFIQIFKLLFQAQNVSNEMFLEWFQL